MSTSTFAWGDISIQSVAGNLATCLSLDFLDVSEIGRNIISTPLSTEPLCSATYCPGVEMLVQRGPCSSQTTRAEHVAEEGEETSSAYREASLRRGLQQREEAASLVSKALFGVATFPPCSSELLPQNQET